MTVTAQGGWDPTTFPELRTGVVALWKAAFGINADGFADDTDTIDGDEVAEMITMTFNTAVTFDVLQLSLYTPFLLDKAVLKIGSFAAVNPVPQTSAIDIYTYSTDNFVDVGESVTIGWVRANGFSFDNFTVTPIPEPGSLALIGAALVGYGMWRRRKSA